MAYVPTGRSRGQPTKYRPEMCDAVLEMGKKGFTKHQMAAALDMPMSTFQNYENAHPEFLASVKQAVDFSHAIYDEQVQQAALGLIPNANATLMIFIGKNRFKEHYGDMTRIEHAGSISLTKDESDAVFKAVSVLKETE